MPTWPSADAFANDVARFQRELEREQTRAMGLEMARKAQGIAEAAASADLGGDPAFSGWRRKGLVPLDTQIKQKPDGDTWLLPTKQGAGPWTVAERGRNADGGVGAFQGPAINMRTGRATRDRQGNLKAFNRRQRKGRRWNGRTAGKQTASDAYSRMERELPDIAEKGVRRALVKRFDVS